MYIHLSHKPEMKIPLVRISRDNVVGIAISYGLDDRRVGVRVPVGSRILSTSSRPALEPA
jgi:glutamine synthetase